MSTPLPMAANDARTAAAEPPRPFIDFLRAMRRRRKAMLIALVATHVAAVLAAFLWPPTWRATGVILIEQQEIPTEFVRSAVTSYADQRVQMINQRVMTTANLLSIIDKFDLYRHEREHEPREVVLEEMREDIRIEMISADVVDPRQGRPVKATIAFSVGYDGDSPEEASGVANELTSLYLKENTETRQRLATQSARFLEDEATRVGERVTEMSARVADFKAQHGEALPEYAQLNIQQMNRLDDELREIEGRAVALQQQGTYLDAQLAQIDPDGPVYADGGQRLPGASDRLKLLRTQLAAARGLYGPEHPDVLRLEREIEGVATEVQAVDNGSELRRRLSDARSALAGATERYSADHPDVLRMGALVAALEAELQRQPASALKVAPAQPENPVWIQLSAQREAVTNELAALQQRRATLRARSDEVQRRFSQTPGVEKEYAKLLQDLNGEQLKYAELRQKQMEAQLASNLESESKGERFLLIEPPIEPQKPAFPDRVLLLVLGGVLAIGAAFGTMALLEQVDTRVRGRADVLALLQVPPLAMVPWLVSPDEAAGRRRRVQLVAVGTVAAVVLAALCVHFFYRPLDVLWFTALRRL